jgi:signal transduction histidine kinase
LDLIDKEIETANNFEQILSSLRHELANSTQALRMTLTVLQDNYDRLDDIKRKSYVKRGLDILTRQDNFIAAMQSYSDFEARETRKIHFIQFWESLVAKISGRVKGKNIELVCNTYTEPCWILADEVALCKVMTNIVDNAVEELENQKHPEIGLTASRKNGHLIIQVKDNGKGISQKNLTKMFIPFYTTKSDRMGMGLPIAYKLITQMRGKITVNCPEIGGTELDVWIKTAANPADTTKTPQE